MRRPSYAAVVAHLALAVALSGGAVAAVTVSGASIKAGTVTGKTIRNGSLTGADLKKNSVGLDRLSKSLPLQYWSRQQSDARFLAAGGTAASALTASQATNATNATNAAQLGGHPAAAYGTTAFGTFRFEQTAGGFSSPIYTNGSVTVSANYCGSAGLGFSLSSTDPNAIGWISLNGDAPSFVTNGSDIGETHGYPQMMTLHLIRGTGPTQTVTDLTAYAAVNGGGCTYATQVTTYTG
ncbi:MAG: hypothetical protein QOI76_1218 [Frankiales bacterium]|nr:hypothetical protein [Frankiales bacterium]